MKKILLLAFVALLVHSGLFAQNAGLIYYEQPLPEDPYNEHSHLFFGGNYLSNTVYMGRKDTSLVRYYTPYIGYRFFFGLYAKVTASYAPMPKKGQFDLVTAKLGFDHKIGKKVLAGISVQKYAYHENSPSIKAAFDQTLNLYFKVNNDKIIQPRFDLTVNSGSFSDAILGLSLDHTFRFFDNRLNLMPCMTVNVGPLGYYDAYFLRRLKKYDATNKPPYVVQAAGDTRLLDIEFSGKASLRKGSWLFTLVPTFVIPTSPATIILNGVKTKEHLTPSGILELDIMYRQAWHGFKGS